MNIARKVLNGVGVVVALPVMLGLSVIPFVPLYLWNFVDGELLLNHAYAWLLDRTVTPTYIVGLFLLLLSLVRRARPTAAVGLFVVAALSLAVLLVWSVLIAAHYFGGFWVFIGVYVWAIIGVVPLALFAALVHGEWALAGGVLLQTVAVALPALVGFIALEKRS